MFIFILHSESHPLKKTPPPVTLASTNWTYLGWKELWQSEGKSDGFRAPRDGSAQLVVYLVSEDSCIAQHVFCNVYLCNDILSRKVQRSPCPHLSYHRPLSEL